MTSSEPICEVCGKGLYEALRVGCDEEPCRNMVEDEDVSPKFIVENKDSGEDE